MSKKTLDLGVLDGSDCNISTFVGCIAIKDYIDSHGPLKDLSGFSDSSSFIQQHQVKIVFCQILLDVQGCALCLSSTVNWQMLAC